MGLITDRLIDLATYKKWLSYVVITIVFILLILGLLALWRFFFPKPSQNVHKPVAIALGKVEKEAIDQRSTQIMVEKEKPWEIGLGAGGLVYDNKTGGMVGAWIKRKF
jgi:hypothetical protein